MALAEGAPAQASGLDRAVDRLFAVVEGLLAALMVAMVAMVFGNVVLRYAFGTGIVVSEELSRLGLVWLTFIGAVVAWRRGAHLGMDNFVALLPPTGRWLCRLASEALTLLCCAAVVAGTWQQHDISATTTSLVTGIPLIWMYGMGYVAGGCIGLMSIQRLVQLLRSGPAALRALPAAGPVEVIA